MINGTDAINDAYMKCFILMTGLQATVRVQDASGSLPWLLGEVRTGAFPYPPFGGFGYIVVATKYSRRLSDCLIGSIIGTYSSGGNVCFVFGLLR